MNGMTAVPPIFQAQLKADEAVTILKRVAITKTIVDAQFIAATPQAASLYGYPSVDAFCGTWQSMTQSLDDYKRTFALSLCRHFGENIPTAYIHRLLGPQGRSVAVHKSTQEVEYQGDYYWITKLQDASTAPHLPDLNQIAIPKNIDNYRSFGGTLSVAEVEAVLAHFGLADSSRTMIQNTDVMIVQYLDLVKPKSDPLARQQTIPLLIGQPITKLPHQEGYLLECQSCGVIWTSKRVPVRCNGISRCKTWRALRESAETPSVLHKTQGTIHLANAPSQRTGN